jgi:threonylcarbamoyladenosine tRNA methylthiotransferase MtaB
VKAWIRTFGCRANQYDSEAVRAMIEASGGTVVADAADADVAIFNSCAVTAEAEADLRASVRRTALPSIVMGCAAARDDGTIAALPGVRAVVPAADLDAVARALQLPPSEMAATSTAPSAPPRRRAAPTTRAPPTPSSPRRRR